MTTFLLIRHAHTPLVGLGLAGRLPGHSLSDEGRAQAQQLAYRLASVKLDAIYASPLERALETAQPFAESRQLTLQLLEGFNEIDFGAWAGRTFDSLQDDVAWQQWNAFRSFSQPSDGEMMMLAQARAVHALYCLHQRHHDGVIAIVSHADILKAVLAYFLGMPVDLFRRLEIDLASVSVVRIDDEDVRVLCLNHTGELRI